MKTTNFILICVFSINCVCKDIISISIDNDKRKDSNESDEKNIKIEISKAKNHSNENEIPISSFSGSLEHYEQTVLQGQMQNPWIMLQNGKQKTDLDINEKYSGRILSSNEETSDLWKETRKDSIYSAKMRSEPQSDNIFHDKITSSFENLRKAPTVMARHYHEKVPSSIRSTSRPVRFHISHEIEKASDHDECENSRRNKQNEIPIIHVNKENGRTETGFHSHPQKIRKPCENSPKKRRELMNVLNIPTSEVHEKPPCDIYNVDESTGLAIASNSTIEVSDHGYQANKDTEESADDDQESLYDYPYPASVQRKGAHYASGALIGERWVLSTAADFFNVRETIRLFRVRVGSVDCKKGGILSPVMTITIHPKFIPGQPAFDVSILKTATPLLQSSLVKPIGLSRVTGKIVSAKFLTTYWPRIVVKKGVVPPKAKERVKYNSMRVSTQKLVPSPECSKILAAVNLTLEKTNLCLKPVKIHHSDCMPDAGAPVVAVDGLWGITSGWVSPQCPYVLLPTLFTRVSILALRTWIDAQMLV